MQTRLLNLNRSTDRLALFRARNPHASSFARVTAVDGQLADRERLRRADVISPELSYSDGALGCALSHLSQWRDAVQQNVALTICEDDAVLCANFEEEAARVIEQLPTTWEYVLWGYNFDAPLTYDVAENLSPCTALFDQDVLRSNIQRFAQTRVTTRLSKFLRGFGTVAYSVSPRGAMRLINFCMPLRPLETLHPALPHAVPNTGIDNMIAHLAPSMSAYVAVPPLVVTPNDARASTVQNMVRTEMDLARDRFPENTLLAICEAIGAADRTVIGIRRSGDGQLATAALRQRGWEGFDIATEPDHLATAFGDRAVPNEFGVLYIGSSCHPAEILAQVLPAFSPRLIVVPPEQSIMARNIYQGRAALAAGAYAPTRAGLGCFSYLSGYWPYTCCDVPDYLFFIHTDVARGLRPTSIARHDLLLAVSEADAKGLASPAYDLESVRLWQ